MCSSSKKRDVGLVGNDLMRSSAFKAQTQQERDRSEIRKRQFLESAKKSAEKVRGNSIEKVRFLLNDDHDHEKRPLDLVLF